ncbi:WD40/YVTN/BNR-like repeat-containing protein [Aureibacter tunicatorum]|uniref:Photosystem II stability/assembly factor-like uncharacterized protein n=1 Tax=Aureibacter tunicatorum TaxID=866807 RepID=A0AAE3XQW2_9BACT|nr:hypothetical protein [Aureibacter tunicatorum]MDR6240383.1 photosystem II stability/assembly factor-like uncharacterized protein [Aureibacter tunicatorum]BDD05736.1 hypothetical protein AUTU_32190 [Aureibacter tunicatorum]
MHRGINLNIVVFLCLLCCSCGDSEDLVFDKVNSLYETVTINPEIELLTEGQDLYARLTNDSIIYGYANGYFFTTNNWFESFDTQTLDDEIILNDYPLIYMDEEYAFFLINQNYKTKYLSFIYTVDGGDSWEDIEFRLNVGESLKSYKLVKDRVYLLVSENKEDSRIYEYDFVKKEKRLINYFENHLGIDVHANSSGAIYISLINKSHSSFEEDNTIYYSLDFGRTWEQSLFANPEKREIIFVNSDGEQLFLTDGAAIYRKVGNEFEEINIKIIDGKNISKVIQLDSNYLMAYAANDIYISNDSGATWEHFFYLQNILNVSFINKEIGIVNSGNVLMMTKDGGKTWEKIIYPYFYQNN